jgi:hypothetical protein
MNLASMTVSDLVGALVSFTFTIVIFSYILGDNPLFRLVIHIFIGVAAGFAAGMIFYNVILNQLVFPLIERPSTAWLVALPPLLLGVWLLMKVFPGMARFGNPVMAFLVGVGAATAIGGAVLGTIFPQIGATASLLDLSGALSGGADFGGLVGKGISILIGVVGTIATLAYFQFGVNSKPEQGGVQPWLNALRLIGQIFIAITFGFIFAGVYSAALTALIERGSFIVNVLHLLLPGQ